MYLTVIAAYILYLGSQLDYNTAFVDEAIYATVGEGILRKIYWESAISWMGGYYIYPLISAKINHTFGLAGIRFFSTLCLVITAVMAGKIAGQFSSRAGEILTLIFFLFWSNVLDMGQMGTYDAPSLALLSVSAYCAVKSRYQETETYKIVFLISSALTFALSVLTKYVAVLFGPALLLLIYNPQPRELLRDLVNKKAVTELFIWGLPIATIITVYVGIYFEPLLSFLTGGHSFQPATLGELIKFTTESMHVILVGAIVGSFYAVIYQKGEKRWLTFALLLGGVAPIAYHLATLNIRSYWKHMVFSAFFLTPLLAWIVVRFFRASRRQGMDSAVASNLSQVLIAILGIAIAASLWSSFSRHWRFQRSWPSVTPSLEYLSPKRNADDKILAEASSVYKYHMFTGFEDPASWPSTWYMEYKGLYGTEAMIAAIKDQYFDYVILNDYFTKDVNDRLRPELELHYKVVFESDYKIQGAYSQNTVVWAPKDRS